MSITKNCSCNGRLKHQNGSQKSCCQMSPKSNFLAFNVFDDKNLEVKHPASKVWGTNIIGVKELESIEQYHFRTFFENFNFICYNDVQILKSESF